MVSHRVVLAAFVALAVLALGSAAAAQGVPTSSARAYGIRVVLPDGTVVVSASVAAPPRKSTTVDGWSYGEGAVQAGWTSIAAQAAAGSEGATSAGSTTVRSVALFGGEITVDAVFAKATARASGSGADGDLGASSLSNLVVFGEPVRGASNARVPLEDWGYAITLEKAVVTRKGARHGHRGFVTGLHVILTAEHGGLPEGTEIMVGYAEGAASAPKAKPAPAPPPAPSPSTPSAPQQPPKEPVAPSTPQASPSVQQPPANVQPKLTAAGYVFPVYGPASTSDSFGAPRATTGWHHGVDIFAALGAPLLAVADGTLFNVGWNGIGGNRLWLRDGAGNEFYYAHLSAYSPRAHEGAQVKAGDVIGFVGNTGDALGTPPHLHFEVHPRELLWMGYDGAIDPYPYLIAWLRLDDLAFGEWDPGPGRAPKVGAVLLQADDISSLSGLGDDSLAAYLAPTNLFGEAEPGPVIVTAEPGFDGSG